ncbi:MAG: D-aminoacyl-tRNA deacylase, partial [Nanoarchaeota archaeon]
SNEKYWEDKNGGFLIAKSLMGALESFNGFATINNKYNKKNNNNAINNNSINNENNINNKNSVEINENKGNDESKISDNGKNKNKLMNENNNYESVFVVGGSHYNHVANKAMLQSNLAVGHICAKYNLESLDKDLLKQAMEKIIPKPKFVLLDWKGLGKEKKRIIDLLEKNNIEYKRSDKAF